MKLGALVLSVMMVAPAIARADGSVDITLTQDGEDLAAALGISVEELEQQTVDQIDELYTVNRVDEFLRAIADATAFSGRGIGVDYASNGDGLMFGVTGNLSVAAGDLGQAEAESEHPVAGVAPNLALMGGVNLKKWGHDKLTFFGNLFYRNGDWKDLSGSITSIGVHAQYRFFTPTEGKKTALFKWGGVNVTAGLELNRWAFSLGHPFETEHTIDGGGGVSSTVSMQATGQFDLDATSVVVPVEATTSLRFLYFFSLYGGASFAFQAGKTTLGADLTGTMTATDPQNGPDKDIGTASIRIDGDSGPSAAKATFLGGLQVNLSKFKIFVQGNAMPFRAASVALGLRIVL